MPSVSPVQMREILCRSALNRTGIPGFDYCMNPYGGCTHGCVYCYASFMCRFTGREEKWGEFLDIKTNFPHILAKQLAGRRRPPEGKVLIGTVTDAYQPAEVQWEITRSCLEILAGYPGMEVHILTKSGLVRRDLDLLFRLKRCEVGFTITTLDRAVAGVLEPGAPPPHVRLAAARELSEAGVAVWAFVAPLLPGLTDTELSLRELSGALRKNGIGEIRLDRLNPYPAVIHQLLETYLRHFPESLPQLEDYLGNPAGYGGEIASLVRRAGK